MNGVRCQLFKDSRGNFYKKETDYENRSWWYAAEFEYGYVLNWIICNGKPIQKLAPCKDSDLYN